MVVSVSTPLLDDSGKLIGVASADISIEQITAALGAFNYKGSGYAVLVDETGTFIYHPNPDHILLKKMADLGGAWKAVGDKNAAVGLECHPDGHRRRAQLCILFTGCG
ncbi:cache domain-containing protein [Paenibacillus rhizoplanae]